MSNRQESVLLKRQKVLADFGDFALQSENLDAVLTEACRLVAEAMGTRRAKVLEIEEGGKSLLVRAGVGWDPDIVGRTRLEMSERSSESFSIREKKPVVSRDITKEERFDVPDFMREAGVAALANVPILLPGGRAYGLLQVDDTEPHDFNEDDTQFLRTYATILGPIVDRLFKLNDLRLTEERFRLTVEEASDYAIIITDKDDRITDWLPGAVEVFGWSADEAKGQPGSVVFTPEDREAGQDKHEIDTARREGVAPNVRWHQRKDGSRVFIEGSVRAMRDGRGEVTSFIKIGQDVTQRRRAEEQLRESEIRQTFLLKLSDALRAIGDLDEIQKTAMRILGEHLEASRAYYFRAEQDEDGSWAHIIEAGYQRDPSQPSNVGRHSLKAFGNWLFDGLERGEVVKVSNVDDVVGLSEAERGIYHSAGVTAFVNVPLLRDGTYSAGIAMHDTKPRPWTDAQIDLIREVAVRTWEATERARVEAALRESEARLAAAFESVPVGLAVVDMTGKAVIANDEFRRFLPSGIIPSRDAAGLKRWQVWDAQKQPIGPDEFPGARAMRGERVVPGLEMLYTDGGGRETWASVATAPIRGPTGQVTSFSCVISDIDAAKRSAQALQESEERFRQFGEASQDVLWIRNARTFQWEYLTPAFETIYGLGRESALSGDNMAGWLDLIVPEDRDHAAGELARVRSGEWVTFEYRIRRPVDGEVRCLRNTDFPIKDATGQVVRIGGIGQDVTEEKETAERMGVLVAELQHRTKNLMGVVRSVADRTLRRSQNMADFQPAFKDRLGALARVQNLLSRKNDWDRITFDELIRTEITALNGEGERIILDSPSGIMLRSSAVQTLSMAIHEVGTNALKYGALKQPQGKLAITWRFERSGERGLPWLHVDWRESGVEMPPAGAPAQGGGMGRDLIERALPHQLGAKTTYVMEADGVHCTIVMPVSERARNRKPADA